MTQIEFTETKSSFCEKLLNEVPRSPILESHESMNKNNQVSIEILWYLMINQALSPV
jgi:hypothetical protein